MDIWLEIPSPVEAVLPRRVVVPHAPPLYIGRSTQSVIILPSSTSVSRRDSEVGRDGCGAWIRNLNSSTGTFVNEIRLHNGRQPHRLRPNDGMTVGGIRLRVGWDFEVDSYWLRWEAGVVVSLALRVRDEDDHTAMPILADALEEVGCTEPGILEHLRGPGPHVRCWVIDAILGRKLDGV